MYFIVRAVYVFYYHHLTMSSTNEDTHSNNNNESEMDTIHVPVEQEPIYEQPSTMTTPMVDNDHDHDDHNDQYNIDDRYDNEAMERSTLFKSNDGM
jgi:hypothetical protein